MQLNMRINKAPILLYLSWEPYVEPSTAIGTINRLMNLISSGILVMISMGIQLLKLNKLLYMLCTSALFTPWVASMLMAGRCWSLMGQSHWATQQIPDGETTILPWNHRQMPAAEIYIRSLSAMSQGQNGGKITFPTSSPSQFWICSEVLWCDRWHRQVAHVQNIWRSLVRMSFNFYDMPMTVAWVSVMTAPASLKIHTVCPQYPWLWKESCENDLHLRQHVHDFSKRMGESVIFMSWDFLTSFGLSASGPMKRHSNTKGLKVMAAGADLWVQLPEKSLLSHHFCPMWLTLHLFPFKVSFPLLWNVCPLLKIS